MSATREALSLAVRHHRAGNLAHAEQLSREVLQADAGNVAALHLLGLIALEAGNVASAVDHFVQALRLKPDFVEAHCSLGIAHQRQGHFQAAVDCWRQAVSIDPDYAEAQNNLAVVLHMQGERDAAVALWRQIIGRKPDFVDAHFNLGSAFHGLGQLPEAMGCYQQAVRLKPDYAEAYNGLGNVLMDREAFADAEACYRQAIEQRPDYVEAWVNLGAALQEQVKLEAAAACYQQAVRLNSEHAQAHTNLGMVQLALGNFEQGWREYEWRRRCPDAPAQTFSQPLWDGRGLFGGTILLTSEQGLGDVLQFVRYAPLVKARGCRVAVECPAALHPLLRRTPGIDWLSSAADLSTTAVHFDAYAPLMSLPGIMGTTLANVPADVPYLFADPQRVEHWRGVLGRDPGFRIGIAWQGSRRYSRDAQRSIPLTCFEHLARLPGVQLVSLQKGEGTEQVAALAGRISITELGPELDQGGAAFMDTAAVMMNLDLVVAPNTAIAHLAGGLGVPVWCAIPYVPEWRWLAEREDSPWYPTVRLFRQSEPGGWHGVFERMAAALRRRVSQRDASR